MDRDLLALLQRDNPWLLTKNTQDIDFSIHLPKKYVPRKHIATSIDRWQSNKAHLLVGPRQAGKSTVIWHYLSQIKELVLYLDCEQQLIQEWCRSAPLFLNDLDTILDTACILFFDEIQHLEEAGLFIKGLVDRKYAKPILVTGSSAYHLRAKTRESLAGRATRVTLYPFSLPETLWEIKDLPKLAQKQERSTRFEKLMLYGGYPEVWFSDKAELILQDLKEAIVIRDASDQHKIARVDAFRSLLRLAAIQTGNLVNYSEWAQITGISKDTVANYLEIMAGAHIIKQLPPFVGGKRSELTRSSKMYFIDSGLRNSILSDFRNLDERTDAGAYFENVVFSEIIKIIPKDTEIFYWRSNSGAEVDFVLTKGEKVVGIEVKTQSMKKPNLSKSIHSFRKAYQPDTFYIVNRNLRHQEEDQLGRLVWTTPLHLFDKISNCILTHK
jgi:predicted AAA+ superfamily ATPase